MTNIYEIQLKIRSIDVDMHRRLRTSVLLSWIQEAAIAHTEALGMGREKTLDKGLLWIVNMQRIEISRLPVYDEEVLLRSWPGKSMHLLFPRYFELLDRDGKVLVSGSALWSLINENTRALIFPEKFGIRIDGNETGSELPLPTPARMLPCTDSRSFTVPYSFIDLNRHMNNTRYLDLAEDCIFEEVKDQALRSVRIEFQREILFNDTVALAWGHEDGRWLITGTVEKPCFKIELCYGDL